MMGGLINTDIRVEGDDSTCQYNRLRLLSISSIPLTRWKISLSAHEDTTNMLRIVINNKVSLTPS